MKPRSPKVGAIIEMTLPDGRFAYGRVLRDGAVGFYRGIGSESQPPPIGSRDYQFVVGVYDDVLRSDKCLVIGEDPSSNEEEDWPPPQRIQDPISKRFSIYHKGAIRDATEAEASHLEPAAAWDYHHLVDRLLKPARSN